MIDIARKIKRTVFRIPIIRNSRSYSVWRSRDFSSPSPITVKWAVLHRYGYPEGTWVETGTYMGETTKFLSQRAKLVYSVEPSKSLASKAQHKFRSLHNITILQGISEIELPKILPLINGDVSFWLDGHYSAGITFQGDVDTPIRQELSAIESKLEQWGRVAVCVDDVRCFDPLDPNYSDYPTRSFLVEFADRNRLNWTIVHDIFCAWKMI